MLFAVKRLLFVLWHYAWLIPYPAAWNWDDAKLRESAEQIWALPFTWIYTAHERPVQREGERIG